MREVWMSIGGFEGFYEVSSIGRVRSLDRPVRRVLRGVETTVTLNEIIRAKEWRKVA